MEIRYTFHSEEQIKERKIEKVWVEETIKHPDETEKEGKNKYYARKTLNGITLEVVYVKEKYIKVVTVYPV
ncbi:DUF4258 domain-containing protein [Candidatus Woesearchaeota archaeon]|nr:DUF4258 domain-containing protein [Candidatus Woesearchaeota archaeon]